jgi:hypothetical protein
MSGDVPGHTVGGGFCNILFCEANPEGMEHWWDVDVGLLGWNTVWTCSNLVQVHSVLRYGYLQVQTLLQHTKKDIDMFTAVRTSTLVE